MNDIILSQLTHSTLTDVLFMLFFLKKLLTTGKATGKTIGKATGKAMAYTMD